jgi:phage host-nuclease inhibitor protein Gam
METSESELAQAKAEIERLRVELQAAQARNTEIIRENVEAFNRRENEIQKQIKRFKDETRDALAEVEAAHFERKAALIEIERLTRLVEELAKENK